MNHPASKRLVTKLLIAAAVLVGGYFVALAVLSYAFSRAIRVTPAEMLKDAWGHRTPPNVLELQGCGRQFSGHKFHLRFRAAPSDLVKLIETNGDAHAWTPTTWEAAQMEFEPERIDQPSVFQPNWAPEAASSKDVYYRGNLPGGGGVACLLIDWDTGTVYFTSHGA